MRRRSYQRALAVSAAAVIAGLGPTSIAVAAPGHGQGQGQDHSQVQGHGTAASHGHHGTGNSGANGHHGAGNSGANGHHGAGNSGSNGHHGNSGSGNGNGNGTTPADPGNGNGGQGPGTGGGPGSDGSPPGNNGNVKIAGLGNLDGIPNNKPHPGCTFQVEWYGFDEGADVISTVTFESQAPTKDVTVAVDGPTSVFVGKDPARGGQDLDGVQTYTLSFTGDPHPKQGFHVRLTVHTPHSHGNDSKTKVFWVEPCTATSTPAPPTVNNAPPVAADTDHGVEAQSKPPLSVAKPPAATSAAPGVPTAVDAGEDGGLSAALDVVGSPVPLALIGGGALLLLGALVARRRHGASPVA